MSQGSYGIYNAIIRELMVGLPLVMLIIVLLIHYFISRRTYFRIEYAGGGIAFDVFLYAQKEIDKFQKLLRQTKDSVENTVALPKESLGTVSPVIINDVAVELRKYMDMVNEGLISQEEYDAIKKKILGI